jgi:outer membrane protein assembly factor BamB
MHWPHVRAHITDGSLVVQGSAVDPTGQSHYVVAVSSQTSVSIGGNTFTRVGSNTNMYLVKMSTTDGSVQWARHYASSTGSISGLFTAALDSLDIDSAGNVYIGSYFTVGGIY